MKANKKILIPIALLLLLLAIFTMYKFIEDWQEIPSENKPYYLEVQKFRFILDAKQEKKRLDRMGLPSFYAPLKDPETGKWIVVGIGPEKEIEGIKNLQEKASLQGINSIVKNYIEEKDKFVTDSAGRKEIFKEMNNWYRKLKRKEKIASPGILSVMPHVPEFSIDRLIYINHAANPPKVLLKIYPIPYPEEMRNLKEKFMESAYFFYIDQLKKESMAVFGAMLKEEFKDDMVEDYKSELGSLKCAKKESIYICSRSQYLFVLIGNNEKTLLNFIASIGSGLKKDPYAYNLFLSSFPIGMNAKLQVFVIDYIGTDYVSSKNYAKWAEMMLGYWSSLAYFTSVEGNFQVELFDLEDKDYSASTYKIFSKEKYSLRSSFLYEFMKALKIYYVPVSVRDKKGWYIDLASMGDGKEVSFVGDEYIVAVDTVPVFGKFLRKKGLVSVAEKLNIFEKK